MGKKKKKVQYVLDEDTTRMVKILAARQRLTQSELVAALVDRAWLDEAAAVVKEAERTVAHGQ